MKNNKVKEDIINLREKAYRSRMGSFNSYIGTIQFQFSIDFGKEEDPLRPWNVKILEKLGKTEYMIKTVRNFYKILGYSIIIIKYVSCNKIYMNV